MRDTYFWTEPWVGGISMAVWFRRLYDLCVDHLCTVEEMCVAD